MATQGNAARQVANTSTRSLRSEAPQIRTVEAIHRKSEQIMDALEHGTVTAKQAEQLNMTVKGLRWPTEVALRIMQMQAKYKVLPPITPNAPMLRELAGLLPASLK